MFQRNLKPRLILIKWICCYHDVLLGGVKWFHKADVTSKLQGEFEKVPSFAACLNVVMARMLIVEARWWYQQQTRTQFLHILLYE